MSEKYTVKLEEDENGDLILPLSPDILRQMGWDEGDTLLWEELPNGSWSLKKKENNEN
jgi:hypothetical protein